MGAELVEGVKVGAGLVEGMVGVELVEGMVGAGVVEGMVGAGPLNWDDEVEGLTTPIGLTSLDFIKGVAMPGGLKGMPTLGGLFGVLRKLESSFTAKKESLVTQLNTSTAHTHTCTHTHTHTHKMGPTFSSLHSGCTRLEGLWSTLGRWHMLMVSDVEEQVCFSTKNITDTCLGNLGREEGGQHTFSSSQSKLKLNLKFNLTQACSWYFHLYQYIRMKIRP